MTAFFALSTAAFASSRPSLPSWLASAAATAVFLAISPICLTSISTFTEPPAPRPTAAPGAAADLDLPVRVADDAGGLGLGASARVRAGVDGERAGGRADLAFDLGDGGGAHRALGDGRGRVAGDLDFAGGLGGSLEGRLAVPSTAAFTSTPPTLTVLVSAVPWMEPRRTRPPGR